MPTIRSTGGRGYQRRSRRRSAATSRSISRSATPPATGAMSWRARASPTRRRPKLLNENFVSIKVDREERPEVDQIYMRALHALGEQGGWPLTMFLTPDAEPFLGRHLFSAGAALGPPELPPDPRRGLGRLDGAGRGGDQERRRTSRASQPPGHRSNRRKRRIRASSIRRRARSCPSGTASAAASRARPSSPIRWCSMSSGAPSGAMATTNAHAAVLTTLTYLCQGGIYDHVGGGFARYSVDAAMARPALREDALRQRAAPLAAVLRLS